MAREQINVRLPSLVLEEIDAYALNSGMSKTAVVEAATRAFIGMGDSNSDPIGARLDEIEQRLRRIEQLAEGST